MKNAYSYNFIDNFNKYIGYIYPLREIIDNEISCRISTKGEAPYSLTFCDLPDEQQQFILSKFVELTGNIHTPCDYINEDISEYLDEKRGYSYAD